jgi:GNAT superfamily N-acetyltransferase
MTSVATIRSGSGTGFIRTLRTDEQDLLRDHLLRLDPESRRDRFNGGIGEDFLQGYAERSFAQGAIVVAFLQDGVVRGAAELHAPEWSEDGVPEIAFSVESRLRRQGIGSALFEQLLQEAHRAGYTRLRVTTGGQNVAMKALARKFGAELSFVSGEASGTVDLGSLPQLVTDPPAPPLAPAAPAFPPFPPAFDLSREMIRASQDMWRSLFRAYAGLLTGRAGFGTR